MDSSVPKMWSCFLHSKLLKLFGLLSFGSLKFELISIKKNKLHTYYKIKKSFFLSDNLKHSKVFSQVPLMESSQVCAF